ncbi:TIGR02757 family protein [Hymenobacter aerilatus]|uniref:TIGR02757 family protein n=1 Tax=Hymenobacter aerilatus TaxID=2932251 RepID=A0A8T9SXC5_9BACT|nr:TIGR02757 family protein [Hymenobacter aerilatus]UOR06495.1 TIGR02757 family protein [Hymenobacter aerilatus]
MNTAQLRDFLEEHYDRYDQPAFIDNDPISLPHRFTQKQDIEISGLFAALLAWGQRKTIINKTSELLRRMDDAPYQFVLHHSDENLKQLLGFCHRTFCDTDLLYFVHWLRWYYQQHASLEDAFLHGATQKERLENFHKLFFGLDDAPQRTRKHVATPARGSACKRVNMYLRWMVRPDARGVDFGLWTRLAPADLICPCDVHVERIARRLGLMTRTVVDWQAAEDLTAHLRAFDPTDPVKYDFALFGLGVEEKRLAVPLV